MFAKRRSAWTGWTDGLARRVAEAARQFDCGCRRSAFRRYAEEVPQLLSIVPLPEHRLLLEYQGGERRCFDLKPLLALPPWTPLVDEALFRRVRLVHGTAAWPGEIDLAPETLYDDSSPLREDSNLRPS